MYSSEISPIKVDLHTKSNSIKLYVLCDTHIGDACADIATFKKVVDFIKNTPDMYVILLGDILNTGLKNSKSDIYSETMNLMDAQRLALEILNPIRDRIIAMTPGNHENRAWKETGLDVSLWIAEKLGIENAYGLNGLALDINFGEDQNGRPFHLHVFGQHGGYGGGRRLGAAMNAIEDLDGIVCNADIYIRAHTHSPIQGKRNVFQFNDKGGIDKQTKFYFNAPAFLTYGGYGYAKGYRPQNTDPCYLCVTGVSSRKGSKLENSFKIDSVML